MNRLSTFKRGFASTLGFNLVGRGMSALTLVVLLRSLSTAEFAYIVLLINVGQFIGTAATGGIRLRYSRIEAERVSRGEEEPSAFHAALFSGVLLVVGSGILGFAGATALGIGHGSGERLGFVVLATCFTLGTAMIETAIFHYQAQLAFFRAGVLEVVRSGAILLIACGAAVNIFDTGAVVALATDIGVGIIAVVVCLPLAWSTRGARRGLEGRLGFGRESLMLTVYSVASAGWIYLDVFLVAALLDDVAIVSYGASLRYISVVMGPLPALVAVFRVRTSQSDMIDSEDARRTMVARWVRQTIVPATALTVFAGVAAIWAIPLVDGGRYPLSVPIFQILLVVAYVTYLVLPTPGLLVSQGRYGALAWINAVALVADIGLAILGSHLVGVYGVAIAAAICGIGQAGGIAWAALRPGNDDQPSDGDRALNAAMVSEGPAGLPPAAP